LSPQAAKTLALLKVHVARFAADERLVQFDVARHLDAVTWYVATSVPRLK
jgi:hypothetical protein